MNKAVKYAVKRYPAFRKRYKVYMPAGKQLYKDVMYLKGLINSEPMGYVKQDANNFDYNGTVISCCDVPLGDNDGYRTGNRVLPRYFSIHMHINQSVTAGSATHCTHRLIIFRYWGEATSGASPSVTAGEVLTTTGSGYAPLSHLNQHNVGARGDRQRRIEVLRNEQFTLDQVSNTCKDITYNIKMNGKKKVKEHIEWYSGSTTQPISGGIYVLLINDNATGTQQSYTLESRLVFYDN